MRDFSEATVVVTGANRADGIGLALVREAVAQGARRVVGTYRSEGNADALLDLAASAETGGRVLAAPLDVTSDESVAAFGAWCADTLGTVDLLVNNAGIGDTGGDVLAAPLGDLERQVEVHAFGMLRVTRALLPLLDSGAVVLNVSSTLGSIARMDGGWAFYSAAKALQNALTRQLAASLRRRGVIACAASPGWVATSMGSGGAPLSAPDSARDLVALARSLTPHDSGTFREHDGSPLPW